MKLNEKWSALSKNKKVAFGLVTLVCVVGLGVGGSVYANNQAQQKKSDEVSHSLTKTTSDLEQLNKELVQLLDGKDTNYLAKNVTKEQVSTLKKRVEDIKSIEVDRESYENDKKVKKELDQYNEESSMVRDTMDKVEKAFDTQVAINSLYKQEKENVALNGTDVKKDLSIVDDLKKETVEETKKKFFEKDTNVPYNQTINELITTAEAQLNQIEKAKVEVAKVYKDGKVISTDRALYDGAKAEVDKIKNEKAKKELLDQLAKVKTDIDKKAEEEKAKAEAQSNEASAQASNQEQTASANAGTTAQATQNGYDSSYTDNGATGSGYTPSYDGGSAGGSASTPQTPSQPTTDGGSGNGQGVMTQDEMDKAAEEASKMDPTKDPNSPWYRP